MFIEGFACERKLATGRGFMRHIRAPCSELNNTFDFVGTTGTVAAAIACPARWPR